jgi:hypothetical protein
MLRQILDTGCACHHVHIAPIRLKRVLILASTYLVQDVVGHHVHVPIQVGRRHAGLHVLHGQCCSHDILVGNVGVQAGRPREHRRRGWRNRRSVRQWWRSGRSEALQCKLLDHVMLFPCTKDIVSASSLSSKSTWPKQYDTCRPYASRDIACQATLLPYPRPQDQTSGLPIS